MKIEERLLAIRDIYNDKEKLYKALGAEWFQKVVLKVEDQKYKFINKFCPNIDKWYDKYCERRVKKLCKKAKTEEERKNIRFIYNYNKMRFKRELVEQKMRNYHMDLNNATEFKKYLLMNKRIHQKGIKANLIKIVCSIILTPFIAKSYLWLVNAYLIYNLIALGINFQCVNLQNYNLYRFQDNEEQLARIESRIKTKNAQQYSQVGKKIYKGLEQSIKCPDPKDLVKSLNKKELEQLKKLVLSTANKRQTANKSQEAKSKRRG